MRLKSSKCLKRTSSLSPKLGRFYFKKTQSVPRLLSNHCKWTHHRIITYIFREVFIYSKNLWPNRDASSIQNKLVCNLHLTWSPLCTNVRWLASIFDEILNTSRCKFFNVQCSPSSVKSTRGRVWSAGETPDLYSSEKKMCKSYTLSQAKWLRFPGNVKQRRVCLWGSPWMGHYPSWASLEPIVPRLLSNKRPETRKAVQEVGNNWVPCSRT